MAFAKTRRGRIHDVMARHVERGGVPGLVSLTDPAAPVGPYGWDGGLGTSWRNDPGERLIGLLMT